VIKGLIMAHKELGESILRAVESISGQCEDMWYLSNEGLSTNELADKIKKICEGCGDEGVIIFVDIYGGSCWRAAKISRPGKLHIINGFNLPMLLSFINKRKVFQLDELASILESDGKRAITSE
jgi:mannose/fructose-specific phosphotransferase system component IIA